MIPGSPNSISQNSSKTSQITSYMFLALLPSSRTLVLGKGTSTVSVNAQLDELSATVSFTDLRRREGSWDSPETRVRFFLPGGGGGGGSEV